ncbi:MAG: LysM peptidoglycan-binding domain-containing protein, partial [Candidatus Sericytochromatia bacterium]|nr:LysM peptidoglycan-binding domain-containing protein [Candidatus Tanganyikabacteria bacterium]
MVKPVNQILGSAPLPARPVRDGAPAAPAAQTDQLSTTPEIHTVVKNDTLSALAGRYGVSMEQLRQLNPELFKAGTDSRGRPRSADGGKIYEGDQVRLRAAAAAPPAVTATQTAATSDRVVAAAKQFIDAAGNSTDPGVVGEAQSMLALIPATDPDRAAYEAKVKALAAKVPVGAPAGDAASDLTTLSEAFNDASKAFDQAQDPAAKAAARTQALIAYQRVAQAVAAMPASEAKDIAQGQLEMMEMRLKGMGASDAAIGTARQAAGLPAAPAAAPAAAPRPVDPAAQEAFAAAQAKFDEASEAYDKAVKDSTSLAQAAAGIQAAQQKALAAFNEALAAASKVGPSAQPALDAMAQRLKQLGISDKAIADAKAKAPPMQADGAGPQAGGPPATP